MVVFLVCKAIIENSRLSQKQIIIETGLSERMVRYCLKELSKKNIVQESFDFSDLRYKYYEINREINDYRE